MGLVTTNEHIQNVINTIDCGIKVTSVESLGAGKYKMYSGNTKWATFGKQLGGKGILEVSQDNYIIIKASSAPSVGIHTLPIPFFFFGTFLDTNKELEKKKSSNDKLPMIYLHLNAPEQYKDDFSLMDFESDCAIYFMVDADPKNWLTGDHFSNAIKPMKYLVKQFIMALKNYPYTNASWELTYTENDYVNFGNVQNTKGVVDKIFTDNISGTELLINIGFNKSNYSCN